MEFFGSAHYQFEFGLKKGLEGSIMNPEEYLIGRLVFNTKTSLEAQDYFKWGFYFGKELAQDLTNEPRKNILNLAC